MTIQFGGLIESTSYSNGPPGKICITIRGQSSACADPITIYVPQAQAKNWAAGESVQITIYTMAVPTEPPA